MSVSLGRYWKQLDWLQELFYLAILATEACLIYPWQVLLGPLFEYKGLPLWALCLLLWIPYLASSVLNRLRVATDRKQALVAGAIVLTALVTIRLALYAQHPLGDPSWVARMVDHLFDFLSTLPADLLLFALVSIGWWRGMLASRHEDDIQRVWLRFRVGVVLLLGYFLITLLGHTPDMALLTLAFFFCGLMSIALASLLEMGGVQKSTLGSWQWVAVLAGSTAGSLALAFLVSFLVSPQTFRTVLGWLRPVGRLIQAIAWYGLMFLMYLLWPLIELVASWFRRPPGEEISIDMSPLTSPATNPLFEAAEGSQGTVVAAILRTVIVILVIVGGLLLVIKAIRSIVQQQAARRELERESLWSDQDLVTDLKNSLLQGWNRIRALADQFRGRHHRSAATVRKLYASMVDLATEEGYPRLPAQTPYEYLDTLYRAFVGGEQAVDAITEAYVRVHYGQVSGTQAEIDQLRQHWARIQALVVPRAKEPEA